MNVLKKICIAGKNDIAVGALEYLLRDLHISRDSLLVVLNKTETGVDTWQKSLKLMAERSGIKIVTLEDVYYMKDIIFISLEFDRLVRTERFLSTKLYNIHFSNLPKYRGMFTSVLPILMNERRAGVTLHRIDSGIDTGNIIAQRLFDIEINDTAEDLYYKYEKNALVLFKDNIELILTDSFSDKQQDNSQATYYSKHFIDFKNIKIDFNKTSGEIHNQIRAYIFPAYQLPRINGKEIKKSILTNENIGKFVCKEMDDRFIISGTDGLKVYAIKR